MTEKENFVLEYEEIKEIRKIGKRIAGYRKMKNMTQYALARKANISKSYLSKIEASGSKVTFSIDVLYRIAIALEIDTYYLLLPLDEKVISKHE